MTKSIDALSTVGGWGRYQKLLCCLLCYVDMSSGYLTMLIAIINETLNHRCRVPEVDDDHNVTAKESHLLLTLPHKVLNGSVKYEKCLQYNATLSATELITNQSTVACKWGWTHYDEYEHKTSAISEFNLVCERAWIKPITVSVFMVGILCSSLVTGYLSDRFGRGKVSKILLLLRYIAVFVASFSTDVIFYTLCLFFLGFGALTFSITASTLGTELLSPEKRYFATMCLNIGWSVGSSIVPFLAYYIRDWRWFLRVLGFTSIFFVPCLWLLPESPQWLLNKGRFKEARGILIKISKVNKTYNKEVDELLSEENLSLTMLKENNDKVKDNTSYLMLFQDCKIAKRTLYTSYMWLFSGMVFYLLSLNSVQMSGSPYVNMFLIGVVNIPSTMVLFPLSQFVGRTRSFIAGFGIGTIACFAIVFIEIASGNGSIAILVVAVTAQFFVGASFSLLFLYTAEIFPTQLRNKALGCTSAFARFGSILSPYVIFIGDSLGSWVTYMILGGMGMFAVLFAILLPESVNKALPNTLGQAHNMKRRRFFHKYKGKKGMKVIEVEKERPIIKKLEMEQDCGLLLES